MIANLTAFIFLELGSGFCQNLNQFLAVRTLYGIAMGGLLGPAAATALEDLPYDARGILSGLFQQAYGVGYVLAAVFYRALVPTTTHGWRSLFWFGAGKSYDTRKKYRTRKADVVTRPTHPHHPVAPEPAGNQPLPSLQI